MNRRSHFARVVAAPSYLSGSARSRQRGYSGIQASSPTVYRDWEIKTFRRTVGSSFSRDVYSVLIRYQQPDYEQTLSGFHSQQSAVAAAQQRIDHLEDMVRWRTARKRRRVPRRR